MSPGFPGRDLIRIEPAGSRCRGVRDHIPIDPYDSVTSSHGEPLGLESHAFHQHRVRTRFLAVTTIAAICASLITWPDAVANGNDNKPATSMTEHFMGDSSMAMRCR